MHYISSSSYQFSGQAVPITNIVKQQHMGNQHHCQSDYGYISIMYYFETVLMPVQLLYYATILNAL